MIHPIILWAEASLKRHGLRDARVNKEGPFFSHGALTSASALSCESRERVPQFSHGLWEPPAPSLPFPGSSSNGLFSFSSPHRETSSPSHCAPDYLDPANL